eukprot:COSAG06_NODE_71096_length_187_cov_326.295455_1_plen_41_part_01
MKTIILPRQARDHTHREKADERTIERTFLGEEEKIKTVLMF